MELVGLVLMMCIGNVAGWLTFMYMKGGGVGLIQGVVLGMIGAFAGGIVSAKLLPQFGVVSLMIGAALGAILLILLVYGVMQHRLRHS